MDRKINIHTKDKNTKDKQKVEYGIPPNLAGPQVVLLLLITRQIRIWSTNYN